MDKVNTFLAIGAALVTGAFVQHTLEYRRSYEYRFIQCNASVAADVFAHPSTTAINDYFGMPKDAKPSFNAVEAYTSRLYLTCLEGSK